MILVQKAGAQKVGKTLLAKEVLWSVRAFQDFSWQRSILERRLVSELAWHRIVLAKQRQKSHRMVVCSSVGYLVGMTRKDGIITR